jgi:microcystin-dependent protein
VSEQPERYFLDKYGRKREVSNVGSDPWYAGDYKVSAQTADHGSWLLCDASAKSRTLYADLFAVISTNFGTGDGSSTFNLPDSRGRTLVMKGTHTSVDAFGDSDGVAIGNRSPLHNTTNSLTLPNHIHSHTLTLPTHAHSHSLTLPNHIHSMPFVTGGSGTTPQISGTGNTGSVSGNTNNPTTNPTIDGSVGNNSASPAIDGAIGNPTTNPAIGGTAGPGGTLPIDTPAYLVVGNLFIHI